MDKVLEHMMTRGIMVAGGDRIGKTIIFAKNQQHADFIADRFNTNYPHYRGEFARAFLHQHLDDVVIAKLRMNKPLTTSDLAELERLLGESGIGGPDDIRRAAEEAHGLGLFVRSLVGMDRSAAKNAIAGFIGGKPFTANQLEFINLVVDHLTEQGFIEPARLYESPFTDITPRGPEGLFQASDVDELIRVLEAVWATALAA